MGALMDAATQTHLSPGHNSCHKVRLLRMVPKTEVCDCSPNSSWMICMASQSKDQRQVQGLI